MTDAFSNGASKTARPVAKENPNGPITTTTVKVIHGWDMVGKPVADVVKLGSLPSYDKLNLKTNEVKATGPRPLVKGFADDNGKVLVAFYQGDTYTVSIPAPKGDKSPPSTLEVWGTIARAADKMRDVLVAQEDAAPMIDMLRIMADEVADRKLSAMVTLGVALHDYGASGLTWTPKVAGSTASVANRFTQG